MTEILVIFTKIAHFSVGVLDLLLGDTTEDEEMLMENLGPSRTLRMILRNVVHNILLMQESVTAVKLYNHSALFVSIKFDIYPYYPRPLD